MFNDPIYWLSLPYIVNILQVCTSLWAFYYTYWGLVVLLFQINMCAFYCISNFKTSLFDLVISVFECCYIVSFSKYVFMICFYSVFYHYSFVYMYYCFYIFFCYFLWYSGFLITFSSSVSGFSLTYSNVFSFCFIMEVFILDWILWT